MTWGTAHGQPGSCSGEPIPRLLPIPSQGPPASRAPGPDADRSQPERVGSQRAAWEFTLQTRRPLPTRRFYRHHKTSSWAEAEASPIGVDVEGWGNFTPRRFSSVWACCSTPSPSETTEPGSFNAIKAEERQKRLTGE